MAVLSGERLHTNIDKLLPGARSAALLWQGAALAGGLALGAGQVYGCLLYTSPSPRDRG